MKEPGICPHCGSDSVVVTRSRFIGCDARGRDRVCRTCHRTFTSVALTEAVGETLLTVETIAPLRPASVWELRRLLQRLRSLL